MFFSSFLVILIPQFSCIIFLLFASGWVNVSLLVLQELKQYPALRVEVTNAASDSLERMREESKKATLKLVDMECSYLTVDFFRKLPQDVEKGGNPSHSIFDRDNDSYLRRIGESHELKISLACILCWLNFVLSTIKPITWLIANHDKAPYPITTFFAL